MIDAVVAGSFYPVGTNRKTRVRPSVEQARHRPRKLVERCLDRLKHLQRLAARLGKFEGYAAASPPSGSGHHRGRA